MVTRSEHREASGFSIIELIVVAAIIVSIAALSLPAMWSVIASSRSRSAMADVSGLFQECRSLAVKQNKMKTVHFAESGGRSWVSITDAMPADDAKPDKNLPLPEGMTRVETPSGDGAPDALDAETLWGGGNEPVATEPSFNPRGMPCSFSDTTKTCDAVAGFVYYFSINGRWSAIGISPAGRIRALYWNGSEWGK